MPRIQNPTPSLCYEKVDPFSSKSHFQIGTALILLSNWASSSQVTIVPEGIESSSMALCNPRYSRSNVSWSAICQQTWIGFDFEECFSCEALPHQISSIIICAFFVPFQWFQRSLNAIFSNLSFNGLLLSMLK